MYSFLQLRKMNLLIFTFIILLWIQQSYSTCQKFDVKYSLGVRERYYSGNILRYRYVYPIAYQYVTCKNITLTKSRSISIDNGFSKDLKYITFIGSIITVIPVGAFHGYSNVSEIYLNSSGVEKIEAGAFRTLIEVVSLQLNQNNISAIVNGTFNALTKLRIVDLSENNLSVIEDNAFYDLPAMEILLLSYNKIKMVGINTFSSLPSLKVLNISKNQLVSIANDSFQNLNKLQELLLNYNHLKEIPKLLLTNLTTLNNLEFSYNEFIEFDFSQIPFPLKDFKIRGNKLRKILDWSLIANIETVDVGENEIIEISEIGKGINSLNIENNKLRYLGPSIFILSNMLIELNLSCNRIEFIEVHSFKGLLQLKTLFLHNNRLKFLPIGCFRELTSLQNLSLSNNLLLDLDYGTFTGLRTLKTLSLNNNNLTVIHENSFYVLEALSQLTLDNNQLKTLDVRYLLVQIAQIKEISLHNNNWTCNSLFNIIKLLRLNSITIAEGSSYNISNIDGIACTDGNFKDTFSTISTAVAKCETVHFKNFDECFKNSTLYKFFNENYFSSKFFNFFQSDFRNYSFFKYFNENYYFNASSINYSDIQASIRHIKDFNFEEKVFCFFVIIVALLSVIVVIFILLLFTRCIRQKNVQKIVERPFDDFEL